MAKILAIADTEVVFGAEISHERDVEAPRQDVEKVERAALCSLDTPANLSRVGSANKHTGRGLNEQR